MASSFVPFPQLPSNNFSNCKFQVRMYMDKKEVLDVLSGPGEIDEKNKSALLDRDIKAKCILVQWVSDKHLDSLKDASTAMEIMHILEGIFVRKSPLSKLFLMKKLLKLKFKGGPLQGPFAQAEAIVHEMESFGSKMEDNDRICLLLLTMPESHDNKKVLDLSVSATPIDILPKKKAKTHQQGYVCGRDKRHGNYCGLAIDGNIDSRITSTIDILTSDIEFILDSGASEHYVTTNATSRMSNLSILDFPVKIKIADGKILKANSHGQLKLLADDICGMFVADFTVISDIYIRAVDAMTWHRCLGHAHSNCILKLDLPAITKVCAPCQEVKFKRKPFSLVERNDIAGPVKDSTLKDERYIQVVVDDFTYFVTVSILTTKDEAEGNLIKHIKALGAEVTNVPNSIWIMEVSSFHRG
ncbi:hypothetical protein PR048_013529 [Dryococelus australis]|uniref:Polyprotein n=1 Tax=Dryococelus australis TaxID=614101 RepID=A0ABQ9HSE8_9NEOP|nr:hypothetical protein PR048_013529 [Dryococelus australis]